MWSNVTSHRPFHLLCDVKHAILRHIIRVFSFFISKRIFETENITLHIFLILICCMYIIHVYAMKKTNITSTNYCKAKQTKMAASMEHEKKENKVIKSVPKQSNEKRLIVVLERASLESVKVCNV